MHLVLCRSCDRHVRVDEPACPFCAVERSAAERSEPAPRTPTSRMRRSAIQFFRSTAAVAAAVATTACPAQPEAVPPYGIADQVPDEPHDEVREENAPPPQAADAGSDSAGAEDAGAGGAEPDREPGEPDAGNQATIYGVPDRD